MRRFRFPATRCGNRWVAIICRVLVAVGGLAGSATADTKIVAITGQSVPGTGGGTYTSLFDPVLNGNGQVAFAGSATGTTNGSSFGVFRGDGTTLAAIVRDKQAAPGAGGGTFNAAFSTFLSLSDAGQVGFIDNFTGATDGSRESVSHVSQFPAPYTCACAHGGADCCHCAEWDSNLQPSS
jgi:hypothetical protein